MNRYKFPHYMITFRLIILLALPIIACNIPQKVLDAPLPTNPPRPTDTTIPAPTPVPSDLTWFAPNMGSIDYTDLFAAPGQWTTARGEVDVLKFYTQNLLDDPCKICGDNLLHAFVAADAFHKLESWGIAIGVEVGAVKPWGCTSDVTFGVVQTVMRNVRIHEGRVSILAMDEPRVGGEEVADGLSCGYNMDESATQTADFIKRIRSEYPSIPVGDIEAYPHFSSAEIEKWIIELERQNAKPSFLHMDIDVERVRTEGANVGADLQELSTFADQHGIPFGVIFTSNWRAAGSDRAYFDSTMQWVRTVHDAIGKPRQVVFQSWQGPAPSGQHEVPINLPENEPSVYSHTRLISEGLDVLDR